MNKNEKFVITINRELGSGGRTVGEKLAEKLGVSFYDKAVIMGLEEKYHLTVDEIEKMRNKKHHWWSDFKLVESEILEDIANVESCVIAGRSGFYVFRNHPNHLRVMIQASLPFRIKRLVRKKGITEEEARKIIEKVDKMRENYVKKFTGTTRYDTRNYDIVISADGKTEDQIVDQILLYIEQ